MFKPFRLPAGTAAGAKSALFEAKSEEVKAATALANEEQLSLYGLYKQATTGDLSTVRPGAISVVKRAKWDAWSSSKGMDRDAARAAYVDLVDGLLVKHGLAVVREPAGAGGVSSAGAAASASASGGGGGGSTIGGEKHPAIVAAAKRIGSTLCDDLLLLV